MLLAQLISLPVSIVLFLWMLHIKKDDPFPKGSLLKMVLTGALCPFIATILTLLLGLIALVIRIGPADLVEAFSDLSAFDTSAAGQRLVEFSQNHTVSGLVFHAFVVTALVEELLKYLAMRFCLRKSGVLRTRMDAVVCAAVIGIAFQVVEDLYYASGSVLLAIFRSLTPFHFVFGAIMGYYFGLYKITGRKSDLAKALLIPTLIHGFFDSGVSILNLNDSFFWFTLAALVLTMAITVYVVVKLYRCSKDGTLSEPIVQEQAAL